jgi:polyhydroxybutyrate depolymerase
MKQICYLFLLISFISCSDEIEDNVTLKESKISNYEENYIATHPIDEELSIFLVKNGDARTFRYFEPSNINENTKILFVNHWWNGSAKQFWDAYPEFRLKAEENNYILIYPNGKPNNYDGLFSGQPKGFGNWWCQDESLGECDTDDVSFFIELAQTFQSKYNISPEKTFATGISMGGVASFLANQKASDYFNGAAPFIGYTDNGGGFPSTDVFPLLMFDGTEDAFFITEGNEGVPPPLMYNFWPEEILSSGDLSFSFGRTRQEIFDYYVQKANCSSSETIQITDSNTLVKWTNCDNDFEMWKYTVEGWGHTMPTIEDEGGIDYADVVFEFFNKY